MSRIRLWLAATASALAVAGGLLAGPAAQAAPGASARPADVQLDLGALGRKAALRSCATKRFVDGRPRQVQVRYGVRQLTSTVPGSSFWLRNHEGRLLFCDMFGRDRPAVLPLPRPRPGRAAVHLTNPRQAWSSCDRTDLGVRSSTWLRVRKPVASARMRFWADGVPGPWFAAQRQGQVIHLQAWVSDLAKTAELKLQTHVLETDGRVMGIRGLPRRPQAVSTSCGLVIA